jgi:hypothetical protein
MAGASRCFASEFLQLGGPDALESVARFRRALPIADFSFARFQLFSATKTFAISSNLDGTILFGSAPHHHEGEGAARLLAAC